ncbi:hypothetical protein Ddye_027177 [Dipteronia dyeriana]|uniref:Uncharacterized protein n=1 Tax=Dipteronia dyeriana TaxID=168575 RepID=A0AAD9TNK9_9ROSI|nr:hypothetical protein Ddye_027177 [Dipteronia dyeriana]
MGGGAAAGKLTGMGVFNGWLRGGISAAQPAEQALLNVSRPAAAVVSTAASPGADVAVIQKSSPEPIARVVFDVPPTLQEAKDATADLKEPVDKVYLSSPESGGSKVASVPSSAYKTFKLLSDSPAIQSVVASIVNDKKVWDAVMENNDLKEFLVSQRNNAAVDESSSDSSPGGGDTAVKFGDTEDGKGGDTKGPVNEYFQNVKKSVVEMVSNVSGFFQNFFGSSPAERTFADAGGAGGSFYEKTMGASLMGLAITVITVVVLKRV